MASLPASLAAEREVLGGILLKPDALADVGDLIIADDFHHPGHRRIYESITALSAASRPIDQVTVWAELEAGECGDVLTSEGGKDYLTELVAGVFTVSSIRYHAAVIAKKAHRRRAAQTLTELRAAAFDASDDDAFRATLESRVLELLTTGREQGGLEKLSLVLKREIAALKDKHDRRAKGENIDVPGIRTGSQTLDWMLGGWQPGKMYVIAGRPGMGKTSFFMSVAEYGAAAGAVVPVFSREMTKGELGSRMLSSRARVDAGDLVRADLDVRDWSQLVKAAGELSKLNVLIDDAPGLTFEMVRSRARRARQQYPNVPMMIGIDYLQLLSSGAQNDDFTREREVAKMSLGSKDMAKELNVAVLVLSQLNRGVENRDDKRPRLSDLRESGAVEQDADVVMFVYRPEIALGDKCPEEDKGKAEIIVAKHRGGPLGTARYEFLAPYTRFEAIDKE